MIIDFCRYLEAQQAEQAALQAARVTETARRAQLEQILTDLLADLEAA